jgi:L-seryl-tRNA(Ser) seleniumtransferase
MGPPVGRRDTNALLRTLPSVDEVLRSPAGQELLATLPRWAVLRAAQQEIARLRQVLLELAPGASAPAPAVEPARLRAATAELVRPSLCRVINATGVVLHTNLGRAPLHPEAVARVAEVAGRYSNLEYEIDARRRGSRHDHVAELIGELCAAEAACVVNNNAAAVLLALAELAAGREVVVSRGELVEIGGSFRIPDVMRASGARLVEVGTTNKTHPADYRAAIGPDTALLLKVHRSNFAIVGFTAEVPVAELVAIGRERGLPTMVDWGSGSLVALGGEIPAAELCRSGADVVTFSGDKLLGGPQAGLLCGRAQTIARLRKHPLMRAMRPDKMTLAALEATLSLYRDGRGEEIPAVAMLRAPAAVLRERAERLLARLRTLMPGLRLELREVSSAVGGGALPLYEPPSFAVAALGDPEALDARLRAWRPPVVGRIADGALLFDVRTVYDDDIEEIACALAGSEAPKEPA